MTIIGRSERVDLPDLHLSGINARIDTGAATSSLHCHLIQQKTDEKGKFVEFYVLDPDHPRYKDKLQIARDFRVKVVKSSNGISQKRYAVRTRIKMGGKNYKIEFTLANRSEMKYPVLIGRQFISKKFLVDVSKVNELT